MTKAENTTPQELTGNVITQRLVQHGFEQVSQSAYGAHVLLRRDHIDVVVPGPLRIVPSIVAEMIERSLEAALGPDWLLQNDEKEINSDQRTDSLGRQDFVILDVVVLEPSDDDLWRAFLVDDLSTVGYAASRSGALADLKSAASLRIGTATEHIVLVTPDVL